jgi:hypothetical protein
MTAMEERLTGADAADAPVELGGESVPVWMRGNQPKTLPETTVLIEQPRSDGEGFLRCGSSAEWEVRQSFSVLIRKIDAEGGPLFRPSRATKIADSLHDSLTAAPLELPSFSGSLYVPPPTRRPADPQGLSSSEYLRLSVRYDLYV